MNNMPSDMIPVGELEEALVRATSAHTSTDMVAEIIWGAAVTVTRAFAKVLLRVDVNSSRIFVCIRLRWWAKFRILRFFRNRWIKAAEIRCAEYAPQGWKLLVYYEGGSK